MNAVKFVAGSPDTIEGLAIPFGGPAHRDLDGEYFTKDTDLCIEWLGESGRPILYHHGLNGTTKTAVIGRQTGMEVKDDGVWIRAELDKNSRYRDLVGKLIDQQALGMSSGAMPHLVTKSRDGHITQWPWVEESLTPTPANPDAVAYHVKSATDVIEHIEAVGTSTDTLKSKLVERFDEWAATKDGPEHGPYAAHGQRVLADLAAFVGRTESRRAARTKADRTLSENDRSVLLELQGLLWTVSADVDALIRATDSNAPARAQEALDLMAEFEAIQARLLGVTI